MMRCALWVLICDEDQDQARAIERTLTPFGIGTTIVETVDELTAFAALARADAIIANISAGKLTQRILEQRLRAVGANQRLIVIDSMGTRPGPRTLAAPVSPIDLIDAVLTIDARERAA